MLNPYNKNDNKNDTSDITIIEKVKIAINEQMRSIE